MALTIRWTKRAEKKFDKIIEYLVNEWNEQVTATFVKKTYDFIDTLADFPKLGTIENKENGIRAFTIVKQINIFYHIDNKHIVILNFFDNRQSPKKKRF
ncbi:MAG: type II toxin-antitoxin system RelE/ParE family toxin [Prolixibacteraceae bacterium]|jgi:plasmid stabilization system protein ParE|nr:type II toxin-antitoxin system RelE/ParE family toxin [Prolixibacteraceae bacterium]